MRDIEQKMDSKILAEYQSTFAFYLKVLSQEKNDKNKVRRFTKYK